MNRKIKLLKLLSWYKKLQEENCKVRVYHARTNLQKLLEEKNLIEEEYKESSEYLESKGSFNGEECKAWLNYLQALLEFKEIADNKVEMQREVLEKLKEELQSFHREKRLVERFTERVLFRFNMEEFKRAIKELDELTLLRKGRGLV